MIIGPNKNCKNTNNGTIRSLTYITLLIKIKEKVIICNKNMLTAINYNTILIIVLIYNNNNNNRNFNINTNNNE